MVDYSQLEVFVLTYNRADKLGKMLDSLGCQTAQGFRITVLDNASTDDTSKVVNGMRAKYPDRNINIITHSKNLGNLGNFRFSQEKASLKYTAIFHDDDVIHPEYLERAMNLFAQHQDAIFCSGSIQPVFMPENYNWPLLHTQYYIFPKGTGAYMQLMISRSSFQTAIYRTDIYKTLQYREDLYGKLHDIIFLLELQQYGDIIHVADLCARVGIGVIRDSNNLKNGPFPNEILEMVCRIDELTKGQEYAKPVLWNFAYFLYEWSCLSRFLTWKQFTDKLQARGVFSECDIVNFSLKPVIDRINGELLSWAETLKAACGKQFSGRRSGLVQ